VGVGCDTLDEIGGGTGISGIGAGMGVRMDEVGIGVPIPIPTAGAEAVRDDVEGFFVIENVVGCPARDALGKRIVSGVRTRG
jgi:hypothetical protein